MDLKSWGVYWEQGDLISFLCIWKLSSWMQKSDGIKYMLIKNILTKQVPTLKQVYLGQKYCFLNAANSSVISGNTLARKNKQQSINELWTARIHLKTSAEIWPEKAVSNRTSCLVCSLHPLSESVLHCCWIYWSTTRQLCQTKIMLECKVAKSL